MEGEDKPKRKASEIICHSSKNSSDEIGGQKGEGGERGPEVKISVVEPDGHLKEAQVFSVSDRKEEEREESENEEMEQPGEIAYEKPSAFFSFFNMIRMLMHFCMHTIFRDITVLGEENVPEKGPVIFFGNHSNQFIDGCMLYSEAKRDVRFLVAQSVSRRWR